MPSSLVALTIDIPGDHQRLGLWSAMTRGAIVRQHFRSIKFVVLIGSYRFTS